MFGTCCVHYFHCGPIIVVGTAVIYYFLKRCFALAGCVCVFVLLCKSRHKRGSQNCIESKFCVLAHRHTQWERGSWEWKGRIEIETCGQIRRINRLRRIQMGLNVVVRSVCLLIVEKSTFLNSSEHQPLNLNADDCETTIRRYIQFVNETHCVLCRRLCS